MRGRHRHFYSLCSYLGQQRVLCAGLRSSCWQPREFVQDVYVDDIWWPEPSREIPSKHDVIMTSFWRNNYVMLLRQVSNGYGHWNLTVTLMPTLLSLVAPPVAKTMCSATSNDKVYIMATPRVRWCIPRNVHTHDDVIKCKHFLRYWPFVWGVHRSPVNSFHKGQWRRALMLSLICAWINGCVNNRLAGDLRRHRAHYIVIVMGSCFAVDYDVITGQLYSYPSRLFQSFVEDRPFLHRQVKSDN